MSDIHRQIFQESSHDFIGLPYDCFDCYDLVKLFYLKIYDVSLLEYHYDDPLDKGGMTFLIASQKSKFIKVSKPDFGDIMLLNVQGLPCHLGIYLWDGRFMHTTLKNGCIIDMEDQWKNKIEGFYRYDKDKA